MDKDLIIKNEIKKFIIAGFTANFFERVDYIIFGFPKDGIEGVIVDRHVKQNEVYLRTLKELFSKNYGCNLVVIIR